MHAQRIVTAIAAAREAGVMVLEARRAAKTITIKPDRSMVTEFDMKAEAIISSHIFSSFPDDGILGEEGGLTNGTSGYSWIVDPIDGTHNFIAGIPLYGVSIGIALHGRFVVGVIYLPETDEMFSAEESGGAFCNGRKISVSSKKTVGECTLSYDSGMRRETDRKVDALRSLSTKTYNIRMFGASSILLAYLADGRLDIAVEFDDKPWDFAAGAVLIREAGGLFTDLLGGEAVVDSLGYVGSNGLVHEEVLGIMKEFA